jgi:ribosomal protein L25 (general stress protein Ctc)
MAKLLLNAEKRDLTKKTKELRANRIVPAVVYGKNQESLAIQVDASELLRMHRKA